MVIGSENSTKESPSATQTDEVLPNAIPVVRDRHLFLDVRRIIQAIATPQFAMQVPEFECARQAACRHVG